MSIWRALSTCAPAIAAAARWVDPALQQAAAVRDRLVGRGDGPSNNRRSQYDAKCRCRSGHVETEIV